MVCHCTSGYLFKVCRAIHLDHMVNYKGVYVLIYIMWVESILKIVLINVYSESLLLNYKIVLNVVRGSF